MNRPTRLSRPAGLPPELWVAVGLLCTAGLFTGVPVLRALPDAFKLVTDGGLWDSIGPLVLVLLVVVGLVAAVCFALAWLLAQGDPVARLVAVVVSGSLAFGLLVGDVLDGTSATVTLLCSAAVVLCLTLPPRAREFFASRPSPGSSPRPVVAAEVIVMMIAPLLLAVGVAYLPLAAIAAKFAVVGLVLVAISVGCLKLRRRLQTADTPARTLVSGLMAGYVVAILVGTQGVLTGPVYIPLAMAVAVVALLWLAPESQSYFGSAPAPGQKLANRMGANRTAAGRLGLPRPDRPPPPLPQPEPGPEQSSGYAPPPPAAYAPSAAPSGPARAAARVPPAPTSPGPMSRSPDGGRLSPPAGAFSPSRESFDAPAAPASAGPPPPSASPPPAPPAWLLDAPPAGFWPPERRRAEPRQFEVLDLGPTTPDDVRAAPTVGIRFDTTSWFPVLDGREQVRGAYLVSMVMFDGGGVEAVFRGTSTLLVTSSRLLGVCPRGESGEEPLDGAAGRVAVWTVLLDQLDWVQTDAVANGGHLVLKGWDVDDPWARLAKARVAADGAFQPCSLAELADVVNRAKHSSA